jgi:hypothetical protein
MSDAHAPPVRLVRTSLVSQSPAAMPDLRSPRVWLGITWSVFQVYTAYAGLFDLLIQLPVHVAFAVALGFLTTPVPESADQAEKFRMRRTYRWLDRVADASVAHIVLQTAAATLGIAMLARASSGICAGPPACGSARCSWWGRSCSSSRAP